jgi:hypothetical protein
MVSSMLESDEFAGMRLISIREAAKICGVDPRTLWGALGEHGISVLKFGSRKNSIRVADLEKLLAMISFPVAA